MSSTDDIIEALGGRQRVAERFGASKQLVHSWSRRGFPAHLWADVVSFAAEVGAPVTIDMLRRPLWQSRRRSDAVAVAGCGAMHGDALRCAKAAA